MTALDQVIAAAATELSDDAIARLIDCVADADRPTIGVRAAVDSRLAGGRQHTLACDILDVWKSQPGVTGGHIALALRAAASAVDGVRQRQHTELVWTGPKPTEFRARTTREALVDVVLAATHQLWLVSYVGYPIDDVSEVIQSRLDDGVTVRFLLESPTDGGLSHDSREAFDHLTGPIEFYEWPPDERNPPPHRKISMHAKTAVADHDVLLVTSANLTDSALLLNMELGVLVRGGDMPEEVARHLDDLIRRDVIRKLP